MVLGMALDWSEIVLLIFPGHSYFLDRLGLLALSIQRNRCDLYCRTMAMSDETLRMTSLIPSTSSASTM